MPQSKQSFELGRALDDDCPISSPVSDLEIIVLNYRFLYLDSFQKNSRKTWVPAASLVCAELLWTGDASDLASAPEQYCPRLSWGPSTCKSYRLFPGRMPRKIMDHGQGDDFRARGWEASKAAPV